MSKNNYLGFWFSYIETLTGLASIFLLLFVSATFRERLISEQNERLVESWKKANIELTNLNAAPVPDPDMGGMRITLADNLIFRLGSSNLTREGNVRIVEVSNVLADYFHNNPRFNDKMRIKVGGHTDRLGGDDINFPLSFNRAKNITEIMQRVFYSKNIRVKITPIAYGSKYPVPGHNKLVEPKNRRITIVIELLSTELLAY